MAVGALGAWLHTRYRWPLQMPGHHGLEWLALLMAARLLTPGRASATWVAMGAAMATAGLIGGGAGPGALMRPAVYLVQGGLLDLLWAVAGGALAQPLMALAAGAAVHAVSPLVKLMAAGSGSAMPASLLQGLSWPMASHAAFGAVGALAGALAVRAWRHRIGRQEHQVDPGPR